jgi:hypothetical protein
VSDISLDTVIRKHTGLSEKELQAATWEEIDTIAQKRNGGKPSFQRSSLFYPGSVYVMMGRFGNLDESRERWEKIGGDEQ